MRRDAGWAFILLGNFHITRRSLHTFLLLQENFGFINRSLEAASSSWGYLGFKLPHDDTTPRSGASTFSGYGEIHNTFDFLFILFIPFIVRVREDFGHVCGVD